MSNDDRSNPPPSVEIPPQNLAASSPLERVLREFGAQDAKGIETGRKMATEGTTGAEIPTYYARLVATALEVAVTQEESKALVAAGAKVPAGDMNP